MTAAQHSRVPLTLAVDAQDLFDAFFDDARRETLKGGRFSGPHAPWGNRRVEHVCRLACVLEVMWNGWKVREVTRPSLERAIKLMVDYYDHHYFAIFGPFLDGKKADGTTSAPALEQFLAERTKPSAFAEVRADELLAALNEWCKAKGLHEWNEKALGRALANKAGKRRQLVDGKKRRFYTGIELISENQQ